MTPTGFLDEAPGVRSAVRLIAVAQTVACLAIVATICVVALRGGDEATGIIAALSAPLLPLAGGIWAALRERTGGEP